MFKKLMLCCKVAVALVVLAAVTVQFMHGTQAETFRPANFFSFFTIESNIFGAIVLLLSAFVSSRKLDYFRGAATLYMTITGVIYVVLLSGADVQTPIPWVNAVLHYIFPVAMLLDWMIDRPRQKILFKKSVAWLVFPLTYVVYCLIRGHFTHWYPYPFVYVDQLGYARVLLHCLIIAPGVVVLDFLVVHAQRLKS